MDSIQITGIAFNGSGIITIQRLLRLSKDRVDAIKLSCRYTRSYPDMPIVAMDEFGNPDHGFEDDF